MKDMVSQITGEMTELLINGVRTPAQPFEKKI